MGAEEVLPRRRSHRERLGVGRQVDREAVEQEVEVDLVTEVVLRTSPKTKSRMEQPRKSRRGGPPRVAVGIDGIDDCVSLGRDVQQGVVVGLTQPCRLDDGAKRSVSTQSSTNGLVEGSLASVAVGSCLIDSAKVIGSVFR